MSNIAFYETQSGLILPSSAAPPRPLASGYGDAGASTRKRSTKSYRADSRSPREDIDAHNATMRQRGRMMRMQSPIAGSAIKTNRTNVIGPGLRLKSSIDRDVLGMTTEQAELWQQQTEREWAIWAEEKSACDATGVNDFYSMQQTAFNGWLESGDIFGLFKHYEPTPMLPYSLRIQLIEADRVATPTVGRRGGSAGLSLPVLTSGKAENGNDIYDGVEVDSDGRIVAYYIRNTYPGQFGVKPTDWIRVEAYGTETGLPNILHIMDTERPDQYRGVSYLAPVIEALLQLRRYTESELTAAVIQSYFTAYIKTETPGPEGTPFNDIGPKLPEALRDPNDYEMGPGYINFLNLNESVEMVESKRPNSNFDGFVRSICDQVGADLELGRELLLKEFNTSYSAARAALLEAGKGFRMRRAWFVSDFCEPTYAVWMAEAVARGRIHAPGFFQSPVLRKAYLGAEWIGPSQGTLNPVQEITAEILACEAGFSTHEQSTIRINGGEFDRNVEQLPRENEKLRKAQQAGADSGEPTISAALREVLLQAVRESFQEGDQSSERETTPAPPGRTARW